MTGNPIDEQRERRLRYIQRSDAKQAQLYDERTGLLKWAIGASIAVNSGAVALVAGRDDASLGSQIALTCFLVSILLTIIAGWLSGRSAHAESVAYHVAITIADGAGTEEQQQDVDAQWQASIDNDTRAAIAAVLALLCLLIGGLTAIWCPA